VEYWAPDRPTWASCDHRRRAVLDCFLVQRLDGSRPGLREVAALGTIDARHDHSAICVELEDERVSHMPALESMRRPARIRLHKFKGEIIAKWREEVQAAISDLPADGAAAESGTEFPQWGVMQDAALLMARLLLGVSGGEVRPHILRHSEPFRRLLARLRLLKVLRRELHDRKQAGSERPPSRAMRNAWDRGLFPAEGKHGWMYSMWTEDASRPWAEAAVGLVRTQLQACLEEMERLRRAEMKLASERRRQAAIDCFWQRGGLRRLLRPVDPSLHSYALRSGAPDTVVITGAEAVLDELAREIQQTVSVDREAGQLTVRNLAVTLVRKVLAAVANRQCQVVIQSSGRVVTAASEKLPAWETALGMAGERRSSTAFGAVRVRCFRAGREGWGGRECTALVVRSLPALHGHRRGQGGLRAAAVLHRGASADTGDGG